MDKNPKGAFGSILLPPYPSGDLTFVGFNENLMLSLTLTVSSG